MEIPYYAVAQERGNIMAQENITFYTDISWCLIGILFSLIDPPFFMSLHKCKFLEGATQSNVTRSSISICLSVYLFPVNDGLGEAVIKLFTH